MNSIEIRCAEPTDYPFVIRVVDQWWEGRSMAAMLPRLFFTHFGTTSFIAHEEDELLGFLVGFVSQSLADEAYIHFVGVHPDYRREGLGRALYERFFVTVQALGRRTIRCVTSPVNKTSVAFHRHMGFVLAPGDATEDGLPVSRDYDGHGQDRVLFVKTLS